ncbi:5'-nucleotidase C-terminal domain-containing protein [Lysinibacillus sp.]|uniref:5'-nucleotidase C-terminal domain-containing protein n=1 Tax=Lysinibacillus sp. TaxID=1869345 RepID=UPI00289E7BBE|nr:5'-nucleotidase C-terminal domain-containing protein [Lysinibacillus sp.]
MENKRNKFLTVTAAALAVTAVAVAPASAASPFSDVKESHANFEAISTLYAAGIISGYPDGTFKPDTNVTRGQAAKMIAGALKLDTKDVENPNYKDIDVSNPYYGPIAALAGLEVITGYGDNTFRPNQTITHGDLAKILASIPTLPELESAKNHAATDKVTRGQLATLIAEALTKSSTETPETPETPEKPETPEGAFSLSILHVNDTHANADKFPKLATAVKEQRAAKKNTLTLHAGDAFNGTLYFNEFRGQADLAMLNEIGFDAMVFGNHEFDLGSSSEGHQALADFVKGAKFPFVDANTDFSADDKFTGLFTDLISSEPENGKIYSGIVKEIDGEKVGIFGLTTEETKAVASPDKVTFSNYIEEAKKAVAAFEGMGVNKIIALTHIGFEDNANIDNDQLLAKNVEGIDIIVGAHDHTKLDKPFIVDTNTAGKAKDATLIVQAHQYVNYLGTLDVTFDGNGVVTEYGGELIDLGKVAEDEALLEKLAPYKEKVDSIMKQEIGVKINEALDGSREIVRTQEAALGNHITDGMLAKSQQYTDKQVVMAFTNGGGIRETIPAGEITVGHVMTVLPFGNTLALMDITGAQLKEAFELSVGQAPNQFGGFLHIAGAKLQYDSSKEAGSRIVSFEYLDQATGKYVAFEDDKTYTVATNAFTAKQGGDGYDIFRKIYEEGHVTDLGLSDWENFRDHLLSLKEVKTTTEGRIVDLAKKQ